MSLIDNERTKLLANALDRASTACLTLGILTPLAGYIYDIGNLRSSFGIATLLTLGYWLRAAGALHLAARRGLKGLK